MQTTLLIFLTLTCFCNVNAQDPALRFGTPIPPEVDRIYENGLAWLAASQTPEGSWQDDQNGGGVDGICLMAFLASGEDPNFGRHANHIRRALRAIIQSQDGTTGYIPNSMYHHGFATLALAEAYGAVDETLLWQGVTDPTKKRSIAAALDLAVRCASTSQMKNRFGGWRYNPDDTDADTSVTGAVLMGLLAARNAGMEVPDESINGAVEYIRRSTGKDGSVAYSGGIGGGGGSINLSAIAALIATVSKQKDDEKYPATVKRIVDEMAGDETHYPEYFRYYMAQALFQTDYEAWQKWNNAIARKLSTLQQSDGGFGSSYQTGMNLLSLALNYRFLPIYER
ncbi:terpene cyclase/mutase family protein [Phragmitibacter flavus]|uniref:Terpene cyclase/mutase family protein n=1 Tax=Phragmitibacter flavus TaxID=2576071 RepID=A0A5R8KG21_9BACT|nr:terpene cyclase/mutase family protein [Phragmitibacter flavus]